MIEANEVDVRGILDYLDYTKTISRLFSKYVCGSVMLYDREYREAQLNIVKVFDGERHKPRYRTFNLYLSQTT
ncbi:hypothetical protein KP79_PYT02421 [Mizuhopecten yessoensis]|nr:hypothetical protein KP79_PYT02421 [Mizuhopecten yessoensis]